MVFDQLADPPHPLVDPFELVPWRSVPYHAGMFKVEPKAEAKPATPKRTLAAKPAKVQRTWTGESLVEALAVKHGVDKENQDSMNILGNDIYFPVCDKLFGAGNMPETPEQLEQAAVELGL